MKQYRDFVRDLDEYLRRKPSSFPTEREKVDYASDRLKEFPLYLGSCDVPVRFVVLLFMAVRLTSHNVMSLIYVIMLFLFLLSSVYCSACL